MGCNTSQQEPISPMKRQDIPTIVLPHDNESETAPTTPPPVSSDSYPDPPDEDGDDTPPAENSKNQPLNKGSNNPNSKQEPKTQPPEKESTTISKGQPSGRQTDVPNPSSRTEIPSAESEMPKLSSSETEVPSKESESPNLDKTAASAHRARTLELTVITPQHESGSARKSQTRTYTKHTDTGLYEVSVDLRKDSNRTHSSSMTEPTVEEGTYTDKKFTRDIAIEDVIFTDQKVDMGWRRPGDCYENPVLFADESTYYNSGRKQDRTSRFLSLVASLSEDAHGIHKVIRSDDWNGDTGVLKCRFFDFDRWETIYTDDCFPVVGRHPLWGSTDKQQVWVALLAKGFARFYGSYDAIVNGQTGDAYFALTGGVAERLDIDVKKMDCDCMLRRICNALQCLALVTCSSDSEDNGLLLRHTYLVTGLRVVRTTDGDSVHILRMRSPFGVGSWTGAWSDGSPEWNSVEENELVTRTDTERGEFWISMGDFMRYFSHQTICCVPSRIDSLGLTERMEYVTNIHGEWDGSSNSAEKRDIYITMSESAMTSAGWIPLYIQLIQKSKGREDRVGIKCELLKCNGSDVVLLKGNVSNYGNGIQVSRLYGLHPGQYVLRPRAHKEAPGKEFLVRIFSTYPLHRLKYM